MAAGPTRLFRDPGTFWHTRVGQLLGSQGFFRNDPFTFTCAGQTWIPHQWLGELLLAGLYELGGFDLQLWVAATLLAGLWAYAGHRLMQAGWHPLAAAAVVIVALLAAGTHFHIRPHLMTIAGMAITVQMLADVDIGRLPLRRLGWLIPLFVVWANVHGGALGGWFSLLIVFGGWCGLWLVGAPTPVHQWRDMLILAGILATAALLTLLNPYQLDLWRAWHAILDEAVLRQIIQEHRPLQWNDPAAWPAFVLMSGYGIILLGLPRAAWRISWCLPVLWAVQAVERCRHVALFTVTLLATLPVIWPYTYWAQLLYRRRPDWFYRGPSVPACAGTSWLIPGALVLTSLLLQLGQIACPPLGTHGTIPSALEWPVGLIPILQQHQSLSISSPARLFNDYRDGGFVIFYAPGYRVFVDDRCELFGGDWLREFVIAASDVQRAAQAIPIWDSRYGPFDYALVRHHTPFAHYFAQHPQQWEQLASDSVAVFYRRRPCTPQALLPSSPLSH
jgi:hypothetical protein